MTDTLARKLFTEFKARTGQIPDAELDGFWATLEPASIDFMIGEWKGGEFDTGHRSTASCQSSTGSARRSIPHRRETAGLPRRRRQQVLQHRARKGEASLWMEEFRGEVTATMVYDGQAIHDHFKKIDDTAVMGIMDGKAGLHDGRYGYFYLERV